MTGICQSKTTLTLCYSNCCVPYVVIKGLNIYRINIWNSNIVKCVTESERIITKKKRK